MQSSLKNICKSLKFFNEYNIWKDGSLRTEIQTVKRNGKIAKCYFEKVSNNHI